MLEAYDAQLDRALAVKLLRCDRGAAAARIRLLREAQALAKVAHPNVVPVYEAGTRGSDVFIAMEYVRGGTLSSWLTEAPRSWKDIVRVFVDAGRGLEAAHRAGIVHRDFKPENVLIGEDGRPRVADFGLARAQADLPPESRVRPGAHIHALALDLTREGQMMGTPIYMSPEHFEGRNVNEASDQFCFAVALYRALFDVPPFDLTTLSDLREAVLNGAPTPAPTSDVPAPIVGAVMRGLARDPADRWPSMKAFLDAIEKPLLDDPDLDPATGRGTRILAVTLLFAIGALRLIWMFRHPQKVDRLNIFVQSVIAVVAIGAIGLLLRKSLLKTTHNRRVGLLFAIAVTMMLVHRGLALTQEGPVMEGLRDEAIGLMGLSFFGAIVLERWLLIGTAILGMYAVTVTVVPTLDPAWFGVMLNLMLIVAIVSWGRGERAARRAHKEASTPLVTPGRTASEPRATKP